MKIYAIAQIVRHDLMQYRIRRKLRYFATPTASGPFFAVLPKLIEHAEAWGSRPPYKEPRVLLRSILYKIIDLNFDLSEFITKKEKTLGGKHSKPTNEYWLAVLKIINDHTEPCMQCSQDKFSALSSTSWSWLAASLASSNTLQYDAIKFCEKTIATPLCATCANAMCRLTE